MRTCICSPCGILGYGFPQESFQRALAEKPDAIVVDAGSTDAGPHKLGAGVAIVSRMAAKKDLRLLMQGAQELDIPLVIGSAGGSGARIHTEWTLSIIREVVRRNGLASQNRGDLGRYFKRGHSGCHGAGPNRKNERKRTGSHARNPEPDQRRGGANGHGTRIGCAGEGADHHLRPGVRSCALCGRGRKARTRCGACLSPGQDSGMRCAMLRAGYHEGLHAGRFRR